MRRPRLVLVVISFLAGVSGVGVGSAWVHWNWPSGNLAEWAAATGTVGALFVALSQLRQQAVDTRSAEAERQKTLAAALDQVSVLERQAELAEQAMVASIRPLLVPPSVATPVAPPEAVRFRDMPTPVSADLLAPIFVPLGHKGEPARVAIPVTNLGAGPALVTGLGIATESLARVSWSGDFTGNVVPANGHIWLSFTVPSDRPEVTDVYAAVMLRDNFMVSVSYTNTSGGDALRTDLHVTNERVRQAFFFERQGTEPFASTGPADA